MKATLVAEGSSDRALIPIIEWTIREAGYHSELEIYLASWTWLPSRPTGLDQKIRIASRLFPSDLLVIHRDGDGEDREKRQDEIAKAIGLLQLTLPHIALIPVRMSEAWLMFNENAIRSAAGNPYGTCNIQLPTPRQTESLANPKQALFDQLHVASELTGRRLRKFNRNLARAQIAEYIDDFSPLRKLTAFCAFETDVRSVIQILSTSPVART